MGKSLSNRDGEDRAQRLSGWDLSSPPAQGYVFSPGLCSSAPSTLAVLGDPGHNPASLWGGVGQQPGWPAHWSGGSCVHELCQEGMDGHVVGGLCILFLGGFVLDKQAVPKHSGGFSILSRDQ